jgi:hypothetical protein
MNTLLLLAFAASSSFAQTGPQASADNCVRLRLLAPRAQTSRQWSATGSFANRTDNLKPGTPSYGSGGGLEVEIPVTKKGTSLVAGVSGIDHYRTYPSGSVWKQDRVRSFPLTLGVLQKIGRVGWTDGQGEKGFVLEPHVNAGVGVAGVTTFVGPTNEPQPYSNGVIETRAPVLPMPWVGVGARGTANKGLAVGLEARRYAVVGSAAPQGGTYLFLTLTAEPKLTGKLKRRAR